MSVAHWRGRLRAAASARTALWIGAVCAAAAIGLQLGWLPAQRERSAELHAEADRVERQARSLVARGGAARADTSSQAEAFRAAFAPSADNPRRMARLVELARARGLSPQRAEFGYSVDPLLGVGRYRVTLPLQGSYRALRQFIDEALAADAALSLDSLSLRRTDAAAAWISAELQFTLVSRAESWVRAPAKGGAR